MGNFFNNEHNILKYKGLYPKISPDQRGGRLWVVDGAAALII